MFFNLNLYLFLNTNNKIDGICLVPTYWLLPTYVTYQNDINYIYHIKIH